MSNRATRLWRWIAVAAALTVALAVFLLWEKPTAREVPPPPAPTAAVEGPAPFETWLRFESAEAPKNAPFAEAFVDAVLEHQVFQIPPGGLPPMRAQELLLEDDELLLSTGRRLWTRELKHQPGLVGKFCYIHSSFCLPRLFEVQFFVDGRPAVVYANQFRIQRAPSHTLVRYLLGPVVIEERKFITYDDRAVAAYEVRSADGEAHDVRLEVSAPYPTMPRAVGHGRYPLLGHGSFQGLPLFLYLDAPGFSAADTAAVHLQRSFRVTADDPPARAQIAVSFENAGRSGSAPVLDEQLFAAHRLAYNRWFADNVPYFDASDQGFKKMWYYRWWVVRFSMQEANTPDLRGYSFYEGKLGFDNVISFAVPVQLKELTYLRDPVYGLDQAGNSYRNLAPNGAVVDPPGSPYWHETYSHWIAAALAEFHRVHPIPDDTLRQLLPALAGDVRAWTTAYDADGDGLPQRARPRVTGYDLDILSFWYFSGTRLDFTAKLSDVERVDFASFVYANARGVAELARAAGDTELAAEFDTIAERLRGAVLQSLWDPETAFFYPQRADDDRRIPIRELHGFFPFAMHLAPNEIPYTSALDKFVDRAEFWARFPPVITSQHHYRDWTWEMDGLTRNIAPHPISMGARTLIEALKHYDHHEVTPAHFMELMRRYNDLVFPGVHPYDAYWRPNAHEYFSKWEPYQSSRRPKPSDISHDFHSAYSYLVVEGVVGLTPRVDDKIELQPAALEWDYFALAGLRVRGRDLTVIWDRPDGQVRYPDYPEGFSLYVDGAHAFTRDRVEHVIYDPASAVVRTPGG
jgi:hypothetical protein